MSLIQTILSKIGKGTFTKDASQFNVKATPIMSLDIETFGINKLPGDCPYYAAHGVAGISIANLNGDSQYLVVNDGRDYGGSPIHMAMTAVNRILADSVVKIVLIHYSKFDLGFLLKRGLLTEKFRVVDTWMLRNIKSAGVYGTNKLKELIRKKFNIATDTEAEKDKWMVANNTKDYGDVPLEIMAAYAADDGLYLMLAFLSEDAMTAIDWGNHDLYMRNTFHIVEAEAHGVYVNVPLMRQRNEIATARIAEFKSILKENLGAADVNMDDDQSIMRYLHEKSLHSKPREQFGEVKFVFDADYLITTDHIAAKAFYQYYRFKSYREAFSGRDGTLGPRIFAEGDTGRGGIHPQYLLSIFGRGGTVQMRTPDITEKVELRNDIRALFVPRLNHHFVTLSAYELPLTLFAYYTQDAELMTALRVFATKGMNVLSYLAERTGLEASVAGLVFRKTLEGSGMEILGIRLKRAKAKGLSDKKALYAMNDKFTDAFTGFKTFSTALADGMKNSGQLNDRMGRVLKVPDDKMYRAHSALISSSVGSILSFYLDIFCRAAKTTNARLVIAHEKEFVFEVPNGDVSFLNLVGEIIQHRAVDPHPIWQATVQPQCWSKANVDSHEVFLKEGPP